MTLADNRELEAQVVGTDPLTDLARASRSRRAGSRRCRGATRRKLRAAEWVLAVGNPFAFSQTVTLGIVSSANRHDPQLATYNDFIQTDAAINPGNSGGALVNARGELVGINSMIYSQTGGYQGIGFAIPVEPRAADHDRAHQNNGEIVRGSIGTLDLQTMDAQLAAPRARLGQPRRDDPQHVPQRTRATAPGCSRTTSIVALRRQGRHRREPARAADRRVRRSALPSRSRSCATTSAGRSTCRRAHAPPAGARWTSLDWAPSRSGLEESWQIDLSRLRRKIFALTSSC